MTRLSRWICFRTQGNSSIRGLNFRHGTTCRRQVKQFSPLIPVSVTSSNHALQNKAGTSVAFCEALLKNDFLVVYFKTYWLAKS